MTALLLIILGAALILELWSLREGIDPITGKVSCSVRGAEPGAVFSVETALQNESRFPASHVKAELRLPSGAVLHEEREFGELCGQLVVPLYFRLKGRSAKSRSCSISFEKRGVYSFPSGLLRRGDFLGLKEKIKTLEPDCSVMIYPRAAESEAVRAALSNFCGELQAERWLIRDPILTLGIREYTGNEPMKTISWSQTAHRGELTVKEFDYTREVSCAVLLNTYGAWMKEDYPDRCCSLARAVCENLAESGISLEFFTNSQLCGLTYEGFWSCSADSDRLEQIWEILARVRPSYYTVGQLAADVCEKLENAAAFVMIAPTPDRETLEAVALVEQRFGIRSLLLTVDGEEMQ